MRFTRFESFDFKDTPRKRAAYERKLRLEREALPLFADQIAAMQVTTAEEMAGRALRWTERQRLDRQHRAEKWREGRRRLQAHPAPIRRKLLAYWQRCMWPADPVYLLSMLHMHSEGRLELEPKPYQPIFDTSYVAEPAVPAFQNGSPK